MISDKKYDLKERIFQFVIAVIGLTRKLPKDTANIVTIHQIVKSVTSIGANYEEADGSRSKKEFIATAGIVRKEAKETKYWLKVIQATNKVLFSEIESLLSENEELIRIFSKIVINSQEKV